MTEEEYTLQDRVTFALNWLGVENVVIEKEFDPNLMGNKLGISGDFDKTIITPEIYKALILITERILNKDKIESKVK